jgi:hypothetical protein
MVSASSGEESHSPGAMFMCAENHLTHRTVVALVLTTVKWGYFVPRHLYHNVTSFYQLYY